MATVSVIIPVFNKWDLTRACLTSLAEHSSVADLEVVVVDNGSTDGTRSACGDLGASLFGHGFSYLPQERNLNFGPACNLGAAHATAPLLFFLNNDTLLRPDWLPPLLRALDDPGLGAAGPLLLYPDNGSGHGVQHLGVTFWLGHRVSHLYQNVPEGCRLARRKRSLQAITGAAMLLPRALFHDCGGFFPGYANGLEDLDLCGRIRERGLRLTCVPESRILHLESQTQGRFDHERPNYELFLSRCGRTFVPDFHHWCREDGLELRVSSTGVLYMAVAEELGRRFAARFQSSPDLVALWDFLGREPLWEEGYTLLAGLLEEHGALDETMAVRKLQVRLLPRLEYLAALERLAAKAGRPEQADEARASIAAHLAVAGDRQARLRSLEAYVRYFQAIRDERAAAGFEGRLAASRAAEPGDGGVRASTAPLRQGR